MVSRSRGISAKFISVVSVITLIIMASLAVVIIKSTNKAQSEIATEFVAALKSEQNQQKTTLSAQLNEKATAIGTLMSLTAKNFIMEYDFDSLQALAENAMQDDDIGAIIFYAPDDSAMTKVYEHTGNVKMVRQDILSDGENIGYIQIHLLMDDVSRQSDAVSARISNVVTATSQTISQSSKQLTINIAIGALLAIIALCLAVYLCLKRFVIKPVDATASGLDVAATQVSIASSELSSTSLQLADGASQQAASLEETSASLEEMSTMTANNAENASKCDDMMQEMTNVVNQANVSMEDQQKAMEDIKQANEETFKIIKTIDEIAFQTNLLALNAAVEAARAGEAGAGFAVVADEVRNLAMRAAEAANDTKVLIEKTIGKVKEGAELTAKTEENFEKISSYTNKVGAMLGEITTASSEQKVGISQINKSIMLIDEVTQGSAASSEQSASAAEELRSQADLMKDHITDLIVLIKGSKGQNQNNVNAGDDNHTRDQLLALE